MFTLYDTDTVHPLDRYDYYRAGACSEVAPVAVHGRSPGRMLARMSVARIGDIEIEVVTWSADSEVVARRTERLIRCCDPGCYRLLLSVNGGIRMEQADHRVAFGARDIGLYDLSLPWQTVHGAGPGTLEVVMVTLPRALIPITPAGMAPVLGTVVPRTMPGRDLVARFLVGLANSDATAESGLADLLVECVVGLIRQRLGEPDGFSERIRRSIEIARVRDLIRRLLGDPALDPGRIAAAANMSERSLYKMFQGGEPTPMQLVKELRLAECHRSLVDPALAAIPIGDLVRRYGYGRADQFSRDFKRRYGASPTQVRNLAKG